MDEVIGELTYFDYIGAFVCLCSVIVLAVFLIIYLLKTEKIRGDYLETLDEHDKSVILSYFNKKYYFVKKKK